MLAVIMLFSAIIAPLGSGAAFGNFIKVECYAVVPLGVELLYSLYEAVGYVAGGFSSNTDGEEVAEEEKENFKIAFDTYLKQSKLTIDIVGDTLTVVGPPALKAWTEANFCVVNGQLVANPDVVQDNKIVMPKAVVKECVDMMVEAAPTIKYESALTSSLRDYITQYAEVDARCDYTIDYFDTQFTLLDPNDSYSFMENSIGISYTNAGYFLYGGNAMALPFGYTMIVDDYSITVDDTTLTVPHAFYKTSDVAEFFKLAESSIPLAVSYLTERRVNSYLFAGFTSYAESGVRDTHSMYNTFNENMTFRPYCGVPTVNLAVALENDSNVIKINNLAKGDVAALGATATVDAYAKLADTVAKDVTIDLSPANVEKISTATTLEDVVTSVTDASQELSDIKEGIGDTNEELAGISGILSSIYKVLQGNAEGTLFDFVYLISAHIFTIVSLLETVVENVKLLADISATVTNISTFVISLPQNIAGAIADEFPALASEIANAIADTFPFDAQDIADAIADTFPFNAQDIAKAISDTFPAFITDLTSALADTFPYVDIREVVNGLSIPSAKDIADAIAKILPEAVTIDGIIQAIVDAITLALTTVLLPDVSVLKKHFDILNSEFNSIFEPIYLPLNAIKKVKNVMTVREDAFILEFPKIEYDGNVFFEGYKINVTLEFGKYQTAYDLYILFTNVVFTLGMFNYLGKEFEKLLPF